MIDANTIKSLLKGVDVKWMYLKNVSEIGTGSSNRQDENENGIYPFYVRSKNVLRATNYEFDEKAIIIPGEGGIGEIFHYIDGKYALHQRAYRISPILKELNTKFLFYYMSEAFKKYILSKSVGATSVSIRKPMLEKFSIPLIPLDIQNKIVNILDTFTALTTELTTELNARLKQYNYYRDKLLSFAEDEVEWKTLDEVFYLKNGYTPSKSEPKFWDNGNIPWFRMEDIRKNGMILNDSLQKINKVAIKGGKLFPANSIIIATSATIGEHALITVPYLSNQRFTNLNLKEEYKNKYDIRFVFYYCFKLSDWCKNNTTLSSFASVDMNGFKKFKFPILPLSKQKQIVEILDKFDTLTNSIAEGLPREIELRQKQYEYYRNLLLDFPKS